MELKGIILTVSLLCNVWFILLLLHEQIKETRLVRFLCSISELWKSMAGNPASPQKEETGISKEMPDVIGKSKFKMQPPGPTDDKPRAKSSSLEYCRGAKEEGRRPTAATPVPKDSTSEKGDAISENDTTFDVGNQGKGNQSAQVAFKASSSSFGIARTKFGSPLSPSSVPTEKLDETFSSLTPDELGYSEEEPEEEYKPHASGCSFDEIADAVQTIKKDEPTQQELTKAGEVMTELDGTELFEKITSIMTDEVLAERLASAITAYVDSIGNAVKQARKPFVIPDKLEDFNIRDYV